MKKKFRNKIKRKQMNNHKFQRNEKVEQKSSVGINQKMKLEIFEFAGFSRCTTSFLFSSGA
jgi:hypothetical protein